jgi:tetratricopeptide (TPR) repeat protein
LAEPAAIWEANAALREAAFGNMEEARKGAAKVLEMAPVSRDPLMLAALVFSLAGDEAKTRPLLDDLRAGYVSNTVVQLAWIPTVQAQLQTLKKNPTGAVQLLEPVIPFERGQLIGNLSSTCIVPAYVRGQAYLSANQAQQALVEFQKILDSRGVVGNCWSGALAKLGHARAQALAGYSNAARAEYQDFFELWKHADPDIPILKSARAEFAKLK